MGNKKITGIAIWFLGLALALFLLFIIPGDISSARIITAVFTVIAFLSQLFMWLYLFKGKVDAQGVFYQTPTITFSVVYMLIQFVLCILMAFITFTTKISLVVNFVVLILMWILILALNSAKNHIQRVDYRQKNHHVEL